MTSLNVLREGEGPIVVLSHALGCNLHMWDGVAALLARAHTVIRYDHRDHGGSPVVPGAFSIDTLADDVAAIQRASDLQSGPVLLVGYSWGSEVVTEAGNHTSVVGLG